MIHQHRLLSCRVALSTVATFALSAATMGLAQAQTAPVPVEDFSVFVDIPSGFAFVKTPSGWRFVRQIEASRLSELHPSTLVSVSQSADRAAQVGERRGESDERVGRIAALATAF